MPNKPSEGFVLYDVHSRYPYVMREKGEKTMNNMIIQAPNAIAIGNNACANSGEISLARDGKQIVIGAEGVRLNGAVVTDHPTIMLGLAEVFGEPGEVYLATAHCSLRVSPDSEVFINGVGVGRDTMMLARGMGFFMRVLGENLGCLSEKVGQTVDAMKRASGEPTP